MKKIVSLVLALSLVLAACGPTKINVATPQEVEDYPELRPVMRAWQEMILAAETQDCELFLSHMRLASGAREEDPECTEAFIYMMDAPEIDWTRSEWHTSGILVKIYEKDSGSLTSFIHNTRTDVWGAETMFWDN